MKIIAKYIGGSQLYKLSTPESDIDYRGVFLSENVSEIIGLRKDKVVQDNRVLGDDTVLYELRRFVELLRKTNTQSIEALFVPSDEYIQLSNPFPFLLENRMELINSKTFLNSVRGYVKSEGRLALGERTGRLGGKRKAMLDRLGFSPKNVTQIIRIVVAAEHFLKTGYYPLDINEVNPVSRQLAYSIKTSPERFDFDYVRNVIDEYDQRAMEMSDELNLEFNENVANEAFLAAYKGILYP